MKYYAAWSDKIPISEEAAKEINDRQKAILEDFNPKEDDMSALEAFTFLISEDLFK